jgi:hypothetical protein
MENLRNLYNKIDDWAWGLSRGKYAIFTGFIAGFSSFSVSVALGDPNYNFGIGISLTLTVLYYWSNPNQREK